MLRRLALRSLQGQAAARSFSKHEAYKNPRSDKFSMTKVRPMCSHMDTLVASALTDCNICDRLSVRSGPCQRVQR